jgi:integrase
MAKVTNTKYLEFLEEGSITTIDKEKFKEMLKRIRTKHKLEARSMLIVMYYTGARPAEVLNLTAGDIIKASQSRIEITTRALKNGLRRKIRLKFNMLFIKELYKFSQGRPENMYLFPNFRSKTIRSNYYTTKTGERKIKNYDYVSNKLGYYFNKWFQGDITPYFFRHNRFSKLMEEGASMEDIMLLKGSKSLDSVRPYLHMSTKKFEEIAKKIN